MTVRPATAEDLQAVLTLMREVPGLPRWGPEALSVAPASTGPSGVIARRMLIAEAEGELLGFAQVSTVLGEAELETIAVRSQMRGQGVGRRLLEAALQTAEKDGAECLRLEVRQSNQPALRLYRAAGMILTGTRKAYYRDPTEDALLLQLSLPPGAALPLRYHQR